MRVSPWHETAEALIDVAMGRKPADTVIKDGKWVNVHSAEVIPNTDVAIVAGRIAFVGQDASHALGKGTKIINADGRYIIPGLCDGHMHIESGMTTVTEFSRAVIPHGTTTMFVDPHEIANVLGLKGIRLMHDETLELPINVFVQVPSCVPSAPGLENAGAEFTVEDVKEALTWTNVCGLGEVMNFPGVASKDKKMLGEIAATQAVNKTVGGHYASPDLGLPFHGYVAGGPSDDHEGTRMVDAISRVRQGMRAMLRLGSAWYDVAAQVKAVTEQGLDSRNFILCTDDSHASTIVNEGHMNRVVRHAISEGLNPMTAIQMATLNTAQHFGMEREIGSITPGRRADVILTSDLESIPVEMVLSGGNLLAENGELLVEMSTPEYPSYAKNTINVARNLNETDFDIVAPEDATNVDVRVIGVIENQAQTNSLELNLAVSNGLVDMDVERDICQIALVERHRATGEVVNGFVSGFGYNANCAVASTVAHDSHHMIVVGTSKSDMALAANHLILVGGGITVYSNGKNLATIELPIAGLMSDDRIELTAKKTDALIAAMKSCGCQMNNAYMQHSLLALVVIPELRISDVGLIDVTRFEKTDLIIDKLN